MRSGPPVLAALALALLMSSTARAATYEIVDYTATFRLRAADTPDVDVSLDLEYEVTQGTRGSGFKYTGPWRPYAAHGHDGRGRPLQVTVSRQREYRLDWTYPEPLHGRGRAHLEFVLEGALAATGDGANVLTAPWVGVFGVPVRRSRFVVVFPDSSRREITGTSGNMITDAEDRQAWIREQSPLRERELRLTFRPGLTTKNLRVPGEHANSKSDGDDILAGAIVVAIISAAIGGLAWAQRKGYIKKSSGSDANTFWAGGCGGGGCGGGGCGGGCGG